MIEYINDKLKSEYKECDINSDLKLYMKVKNKCIEIKEKLSAIGASEVNYTIESINHNEDNFEGVITVEELNEILKETINEYDTLLNEMTNDIRLKADEKIEVMIIGGTMRISILKDVIKKRNNMRLNETMNMDESVSSGNCYYGLIKENEWIYDINDIEESERLNDLNEMKIEDIKVSEMEYYNDILNIERQIEEIDIRKKEIMRIKIEYEKLMYFYI